MISLSTSASQRPLEPGDDLIAHLGASPRPAVIHYTAEGRTELSGRVAVNWATKTTHLIDSYGIAAPDTMLVDVPVTWRSLVLVLGVAWCELECTTDSTDAAAIFTDRPQTYAQASAELFITHLDDVDPAMVDVDDEVLSHADQALLPVGDIIGRAVGAADNRHEAVQVHPGGTVLRGHQMRLDPAVWSAIVEAWRHRKPVVIVEDADDAQLARILETERLG